MSKQKKEQPVSELYERHLKELPGRSVNHFSGITEPVVENKPDLPASDTAQLR